MVRSWTVGCLLGVLALQWQARLPATWLLLALGVVAALAGAGALLSGRAHAVRACVAALLCGACLGFAWSGWLAHSRLSGWLAPSLEGRDLVLEGTVASLPQPFDGGVRFEFDVDRAYDGAGIPLDAGVPSRVALSWYTGMSREAFQELAPLRAAERWRLPVRLKRPHGGVNPHGFDYEAWLLERGLGASGSVRRAGVRGAEGGGGARRLPDAGTWQPAHEVERAREAIRERFIDALPTHRFAGVLLALAIGDQRAIDGADWQVFARTGVSHLMSISGLHVTMVAGLFAWLALFAWRSVPCLPLWLAAQRAAAAAGLLAAFAYCLLSGFAVPAQRTLYMVGVAALALWLGRASSPSRVLCAALALVLLLDPWAVLAPGFWLSFGAVAVIFIAGSGVAEHASHPEVQSVAPSTASGAAALGGRLLAGVLQWGRVQWAITLALAPLLLLLFQQVSLSSPLANAIAIPVVSLVVTPLAIAGAVLPDWAFGAEVLALAHWVFALLWPLLEWLAGLQGAVWQQHAPQAWTVALACVGVLWMIAPRGVPARATGVALLLPLFLVEPPRPPEGGFRALVLDVGQGEAVLVQTRSHALLFDAGPAWGPDSDAAGRVVLPVLRAAGVARLDALVLSHWDRDHAGGTRSLLQGVGVDSAWVSSEPLADLALALGAARDRRDCRAGESWEWDGVAFRFLHPDAAMAGDPLEKGNDRSCVLRVSSAGGSLLLTADIEARAESRLLARDAQALRSDVLLAPHHGSISSSTQAFLDAVAPRMVLVSAGYRNRFGHPRAEVLARYDSLGARVLRTDRDGALEVSFDPGAPGRDGMTAFGWRARQPRYWREAAVASLVPPAP